MTVLSKMIGATSVALAATTGANAAFFKETFNAGWEDRWVASEWKPSNQMGDFELTAGKYFKDEAEDKGIMTATDSRFNAISASFEPFSNKDKTLYIQYTLKYEKDLECGGGYLKFGPKIADAKTFGDPTSYNIMFGPDKCGAKSRTHLIFTYKGKNVLKKTDLAYKQGDIGSTQLYQLKLTPENKVTVTVGGSQLYEGELEKDWELLEPKQINDPSDKKPSDWVDEAMMDDPEDKKPEDWDQAEEIVDPDATQPEDWDAEEDGEWEPPMIKNPAFKGEWKPKKISNPDYKGPWVQKKMDNPEYEANDALYKFDEFAFVGIDLWQVKSGSLFDNILITDKEDEAKAGLEAWKEMSKVEKEAKDADKKKAEEESAKKEDEDDSVDVDDDDDAGDDEDL